LHVEGPVIPGVLINGNALGQSAKPFICSSIIVLLSIDTQNPVIRNISDQ
jgi:hypothetical protein